MNPQDRIEAVAEWLKRHGMVSSLSVGVEYAIAILAVADGTSVVGDVPNGGKTAP